jgi:hypothetical protein
MIINFSVIPKKNPPDLFDSLRLAIPNNFSKGEIEEIIAFLKTYISHKYGLNIQFTPSKPIGGEQKTKKITLRHFYNYDSLVKIRKGIRDIEFNVELGGLQGRILMFFQDENQELYFIQWTRDSFLKLPEAYLSQLRENKLPWSGTYIESSDLMPVKIFHSTESLEPDLITKYVTTLSEPMRRVWENEILPKNQLNQDVFYVWETLFAGINQPIQLTYRLSNPEETTCSTTCVLRPAGYDSIYGVWVFISNPSEEYIIPLSQILHFEDPELNQLLQIYLDWVQIFCPET